MSDGHGSVVDGRPVVSMDGAPTLWNKFHRAWGTCVGLPRYDKKAWRSLENDAWRASTSSPWYRTAVLASMERLLAEQWS